MKLKIKEITPEDKTRDWKIQPMHCYSLHYDTCTGFPICPKYCHLYSKEPIKSVAIAYYNGTCYTRELDE